MICLLMVDDFMQLIYKIFFAPCPQTRACTSIYITKNVRMGITLFDSHIKQFLNKWGHGAIPIYNPNIGCKK